MAYNAQSVDYLQRSTEVIDVQNLPLNDYTSSTRSAAHLQAASEYVSVRQVPMYELSKPPATPQSRTGLLGGSARLQRRTSGKMQRPVAYLQHSSESFRLRADSGGESTAGGASVRHQRPEHGLLRLRKPSTEQTTTPRTPTARNSTFVSQIQLKPQQSERGVRRKHSVGAPDRLHTPQERETAKVRRHTSLSPRTLKQASHNVSQRLVIDSSGEHSDLLIISSSSRQASNLSQTQWPSSESFSSCAAEHSKTLALPRALDQQKESLDNSSVLTDDPSAIDVRLQKDCQSALDDETALRNQPLADAADAENVTSQSSDLTLSSLRLSMAEFEPAPAPPVRRPPAKRAGPLSVAQKTIHRSVQYGCR